MDFHGVGGSIIKDKFFSVHIAHNNDLKVIDGSLDVNRDLYAFSLDGYDYLRTILNLLEVQNQLDINRPNLLWLKRERVLQI